LLYIIISILFVLMLILLSFLLIPLNLSLNLKKQGSEIKCRFNVRFLGIIIFSKEIPEKKKGDNIKEKFDPELFLKILNLLKESFELDRIVKISNLLKESLRYFKRLINTLFRSFTLKNVSCNLTIGLESSADTAMLTGFILSFLNMLNAIKCFDFIITPNFDKRVLDLDFNVEAKFKLIWVVFEAIRTYSKKPVRELIHEMRGLMKRVQKMQSG